MERTEWEEKVDREIIDIRLKQIGNDQKIERYIEQSIRTEEQSKKTEQQSKQTENRFLKSISNIFLIKWLAISWTLYMLYNEIGFIELIKLLK